MEWSLCKPSERINRPFKESVVKCKMLLEVGETMRLDCALGIGSTGQETIWWHAERKDEVEYEQDKMLRE